MYINAYLGHFAVQQKLTEHKSTIIKKFFKKEGMPVAEKRGLKMNNSQFLPPET